MSNRHINNEMQAICISVARHINETFEDCDLGSVAHPVLLTDNWAVLVLATHEGHCVEKWLTTSHTMLDILSTERLVKGFLIKHKAKLSSLL